MLFVADPEAHEESGLELRGETPECRLPQSVSHAPNLRVHFYICDAYRVLGIVDAASARAAVLLPSFLGFAPKTLVFPSGLGPRASARGTQSSARAVPEP